MWCNDELSTFKSHVCLRTERSGVSRTDCRTISTSSSVLDDLDRSDLGLSTAEAVSSNLRTHPNHDDYCEKLRDPSCSYFS